jgi:ATP-dependent Clp protease ATP-binding subunit ClpC
MSDHNIFDRFSPNARKILISAQKIARSMNSALGSEHILLALAITPKTLAQSILREQMVGLDQIRLIVSLHHFTKESSPGMTQEAKDALKAAAQAALDYKHDQIESEHLLWGIVSQGNFHAAEIVDRIGTDPQEILNQIRGFFEEMEETGTDEEEISETQMDFLPQDQPMPGLQMFGPQMPKVTLESFTTDLTQMAKNKKIDPVIGRDKEIQRVIQILGRRTKNNPVLVGDPGVGKTAIVEGLAQRIVDEDVPPSFIGKKLISLDLALLIAGTMYRGQFEERIKRILDELMKQPNTILFIDEIHTIVGAGSAEGSLDVANILKPALAKGRLHLIGATTHDEYRKFIEKDAALERRLQRVSVPEPTPDETISILEGIKKNFEEHHGVKISEEAIKTAVELSTRYISDRHLPDKAIDLIDEAASAWQLRQNRGHNNEAKKIREEIQQIRSQKEKEVELEDFPKAAQLRTLELRLEEKLKNIKNTRVADGEIGSEDIARIISQWTSIPLESLKVKEKIKFAKLSQNLKKKIIGQDEAIEDIANAIKRNKSGLSDPNRPIGSFIFLGPTGVGKTELAKVLAEELFADRNALIKIDMSEFMEHHNVSRLVGAPPGYVGYEDAGKLTEKIRQRPYSIVLFDEIEKADPQVFNILLQILEEGALTDGQGRKINFRNTIVIMTSNLGMQELNHESSIGFTAKRRNNLEYDKMKDEIIRRLKDAFRPELLNRLDKIVVFQPLGKLEIKKIAQLQLNELNNRLSKHGYELFVDPKVTDQIAEAGFDPAYGARPIRRAIMDLIENPLAEEILLGRFVDGDTIKIALDSNHIIFTKVETQRKI